MSQPFGFLRTLQGYLPAVKRPIDNLQQVALNGSEAVAAARARVGQLAAGTQLKVPQINIPIQTPSPVNKSGIGPAAPLTESPQAQYLQTFSNGFVNLRRQSGQ